MEAGHVRIDRPTILEIDTVRAIADGHTIYRAGTTVFLTDEVPGEYLYKVDEDDPMIRKSSSSGNLKKRSEPLTALLRKQDRKVRSGSRTALHVLQ